MATFERKHQSTIAGTPVIGVPVVRRRQPMAKNQQETNEQAKRQGDAAKAHEAYLKKQGVKPVPLDSNKKTKKKDKED